MINQTVVGAPNIVCRDLRDAIRSAGLSNRMASQLDLVVERLVHAYAGDMENVTVTLVVDEENFSLKVVQ